MKILFSIDTMTKGGAERVISNLANIFSKNNEDVSILTLLKGDSAYQLDSKIKYTSLEIKEGKKNIFQKIYYYIANLFNIRKFVKTNKYDIVVSFLPRMTFYMALATLGTKTKLIISERNDPASIYVNPIKKYIYKRIFELADGIVFQTSMARNFFSKKVYNKSIIIPNPVNDLFYQKREFKKRNKNIVNVGRLTEQKNQKLLIDAFYDFSKKHNDYNLIIYGEGPLRIELEEYIKSLKLEALIKLPGIIDNIADKIVNSSMFVFTSNYEGMPNALMEAMTLGIPCISTDCPCGGPREIIDNGINGFLVPVGEKNEIVYKMEEIISADISQKFSINAIEKMQLYKNDLINEKWKNYIEKVLKG